MKKITFLFVYLILAITSWADSVTSGTLARTNIERAEMAVTYLDWTSDSGGNVVVSLENIEGTILRVTTNPDDGATSPTANYDVTLTDQDAVDIFDGGGSNLSQSDVKTWTPDMTSIGAKSEYPFVTYGTLTLTVSNAGATKGGMIRIYYRPRRF